MPVESDENPSDTSCADAECSVVDDHEHKKTNSDGSSLWPSADILAWKEVVVRTHTETLQTWSPSTSSHHTVTRADLAGGIRRGVEDYVYIVGVEVEEEEVVVLAGSRYIPSPCLRSVSLTEAGDLQPRAHFLKAGPSTRCSLRLKQSNIFVTGGEDGVIRVWRKVEAESAPASSQDSTRKITTNETSRVRKKPYSK